jgi:putative glutamine amidotransferase
MPTSDNRDHRPRIGIPYRTLAEQLNKVKGKHEPYVCSVERAGGESVPIELNLPLHELEMQARELDAIVLPGSPADVDPVRYRATRHSKTADADLARETTDLTMLRHCFGEGKPILAICYGVQILNVYLGGSLIQDISSEIQTAIEHAWNGRERRVPEPFHQVNVEAGSAALSASGKREGRVNSSHHQAIREPGRDLRVTARASDGIIEAVEWIGDANWVTGVQWHPERMTDDAFAQRLFGELVAAARNATVRR